MASIALSANSGRPVRQSITDDNLRAIGKAFGVTLNENVLNYHPKEFEDYNR